MQFADTLVWAPKFSAPDFLGLSQRGGRSTDKRGNFADALCVHQVFTLAKYPNVS
jgi:hypothetical protein